MSFTIGLVITALIAFWLGRRRRGTTPAAPPNPAVLAEPVSTAPTHVMPLEQIKQKVARKYPGDTDRQDAIAKDIARAAAGLIPGAKPRGSFP